MKVMNVGLQQVSTRKSPAFGDNQVSLQKRQQYTPSFKSGERVGLFQGIKNVIAFFKRAWIKTTEYTAATIDGIIKGSALGALTFVGIGIKNFFSKANAEKQWGEKLSASVPGKMASILSFAIPTVLMVGKSWFSASIRVSKRESVEVDHPYNQKHL